MALLSQQQIKNWWNSQTSDADHAQIASAIAMAASGGDSAKVTPIPGTSDALLGLWQFRASDIINDPHLQLYGPPDFLLGHIGDQVLAAFNFSAGGSNWSPWPWYVDGAYLAFMSGNAPAPAPGPTFIFGQSQQDQWMLQWWTIIANWVEIFAPQLDADVNNLAAVLNGIG